MKTPSAYTVRAAIRALQEMKEIKPLTDPISVEEKLASEALCQLLLNSVVILYFKYLYDYSDKRIASAMGLGQMEAVKQRKAALRSFVIAFETCKSTHKPKPKLQTRISFGTETPRPGARTKPDDATGDE